MSCIAAKLAKLFLCALLLAALGAVGFAQNKKKVPTNKPAARTTGTTTAPKVTVIDIEGLRKVLKPGGKPLMINFWATWCDPCREEFPDLVKLDDEFRGKIDFRTVSLDYEEELKTGVPKFLAEMKAMMPAYLLVTPDADAAITAVSNQWSGALPLTVIYSSTGELVYFRQGIIKSDAIRGELKKLL